MLTKNAYWYYKSAISPEDCKKIIDLGLNTIQQTKERGETTLGSTGGDKQISSERSIPQADLTSEDVKDNKSNVYVRDSEVAWLEEDWIYDLVNPLIDEANENAGWRYETSANESLQFTVYKPGGFYGWHADGNSDHYAVYKRYIHGVTPVSMKKDGTPPYGYTKNWPLIGKIRKLSMTINLNLPGEYDGGNLKFDYGPHVEGNRYHECEEIRPQGSVIIFPSYVYHQVTPVTRGTRYSLVLWRCGEPFK